MLFTDLLISMDSAVTSANSKLHLATPAGQSKPLDAFLAGTFEEWQSWQGKLNFDRPFVVSLIRLQGLDRWLFAGVFDSFGSKWDATHK